jgi:hypothetical protein
MGRITFTADAQHEEIVDQVQAEDGVESQSAAVRECITRYADLQQRESDLRNQVDELETELDRVRNEKRLLLEEREEKAELVKYVQQERTAEQRWREAGVGTRLKWRLFGMPGDG